MVAEPEREAPGAAPSTPAMHHRATVLVAEDERAVRGVVQTMLQRAGFDVLEAVSGEDALRVAEHHAGQIDLLLTDIIMSGINGRQLAEQLTARRPGLAVLYMSGYTDDPRVQEIVLHANGTYVQKPFDADTLTRKIRQALEAPPA
jgi:DNA-binding NtrC family response regulator